MTARPWLSVAVLLTLAECREAAAPLNAPPIGAPALSAEANPAEAETVEGSGSSKEVHVLRQSTSAPKLETYQVSFWAFKNKASTVTVNYQARTGQRVGDPYLRFDIPKNGLKAKAGGWPLAKRDSVRMTLTIDPASFVVDFEPSGVLFSRQSPANLIIWYENANPDLNGDGVVNATDRKLEQQLALWHHAKRAKRWFKLSSKHDSAQPAISTPLYHFSVYAVSW